MINHKSRKKSVAPWAVFVAIMLAVFVGTWTGKEGAVCGVRFYAMYDVLGALFIKALTLVVVPLVSSSIITGVAKMGGDAAFGRLGLKTFGFYISTTLLAVLTGLALVNLIGPGFSEGAKETNVAFMQLQELEKHLVKQETSSFMKVFLQVIPTNLGELLSHGNMLGLIFFSILFGYGISRVSNKHNATVLLNFWEAVFQTMLVITHLILKLLPLGVFCLVAKVFAERGFESLKSLLLFSLTVVLGLLVFACIVLPLMLWLIGKVNPLTHFKAMAPALITAFSTSSSSATLPVTLECAEKRAGMSNRIASLVIPLGSSINLSGSALYECVAAMFVAQVYGLELSFATQFTVVLLSLLTSIGVAGIPSGSLVAIIVILKAIGLPAEAIGLFLAVDRLLDMCRTTVNVFSDACCAVLVARSEGETKVLSRPDCTYTLSN